MILRHHWVSYWCISNIDKSKLRISCTLVMNMVDRVLDVSTQTKM